MLLFVKQRFVDQILAGTKRFEIRFGSRYRKILPGDDLSINGRFRVRVIEVSEFDTVERLCRRTGTSEHDILSCYPNAAPSHENPFRVFWFDAPATPKRPAAEQLRFFP